MFFQRLIKCWFVFVPDVTIKPAINASEHQPIACKEQPSGQPLLNLYYGEYFFYNLY